MFNLFNNFKNDTKNCFVFQEIIGTIHIYKKNNGNILYVGNIASDLFETEIVDLCKKDKDLYIFDIYFILSKSQYEIINIDKVPLNEGEVGEYVKWKVGELVNTPSNEIVAEIVFNNNNDHQFFKKNLTVFVANKKTLNKVIDLMKKFKLNLKVIDVPELAARNLFINLGINPTIVYVYFRILTDVTIFNIFLGDSLLLSRKVDRGFDTMPIEIFNEKILLEVQRSIDFLDRQHNISQFSHFFVSSENKILVSKFSEDIINYFKVENMSLGEDIVPPEILGEFLRAGKI